MESPGGTPPLDSIPPEELEGGPAGPPLPAGPAAANGERHSLASLGHGSFLTLIGQIVLVGATFGNRVLLVHALGLTLYGDLAVGIAVTGLVAQLASLGLPMAVARQLAHTTDPKERWTLVVHSLTLALPLAMIAGLALFLLAGPLGQQVGDSTLTTVLQFLSVNMALGIASGMMTAFFQGNEDALPNSLFNQILNPSLIVVFLVVLLPRAPNVASALWAYVVAGAITLAGVLAYSLSRRGHPWRRAETAAPTSSLPRVTSMGTLLSFALPLVMVGLATASVGSADTLVLEALTRSPLGVGSYNSVLPLARLVTLAVIALGYIMLPVASRLHRVGDLRELARSYATMTKWVLLVSLPMFLIFFFLPTASLAFVYGPSNVGPTSGVLLQVTCLGALAAALAGPAAPVLIGLGQLRLLFVNTAVSALVDVGISLALVPLWGPLGAACAFAAGTASLPLLCVAQTYRLAGVHPFTGAVLRPVALVLLPAGTALALLAGPLHVHLAGMPLVLLYFVLFASYLGAIFLTRSVEVEDSHLLEVVEGYLGRPLPWVRRLGSRYLPPATDPSPPPTPPRK